MKDIHAEQIKSNLTSIIQVTVKRFFEFFFDYFWGN